MAASGSALTFQQVQSWLWFVTESQSTSVAAGTGWLPSLLRVEQKIGRIQK